MPGACSQPAFPSSVREGRKAARNITLSVSANLNSASSSSSELSVRPVQVLEKNHDGALSRHQPDEVSEAFEDELRQGISLDPAHPLGVPAAQREPSHNSHEGKDLPRIPRSCRLDGRFQLCAGFARVILFRYSRPGVQHLEERVKAEVPADRLGASLQERYPSQAVLPEKLCEQPRLPDPGFAFHEDHRSLTVDELERLALEQFQLILPAHELGTHAAVQHVAVASPFLQLSAEQLVDLNGLLLAFQGKGPMRGIRMNRTCTAG